MKHASPLSTFLQTLIFNGFTVTFSEYNNKEIEVSIQKDDRTLAETVDIPYITTGYEIDDLLYLALQRLYADYDGHLI